MEARVYYKDGRIESHRIPEYVGSGSTIEHPGGSETRNTIDRVRGIIERFVRNGDGFWLERILDAPPSLCSEDAGVQKARSTSTLVIAQSELDQVRLILLDGEQVYPEVADEADGANYLDAVGF